MNCTSRTKPHTDSRCGTFVSPSAFQLKYCSSLFSFSFHLCSSLFLFITLFHLFSLILSSRGRSSKPTSLSVRSVWIFMSLSWLIGTCTPDSPKPFTVLYPSIPATKPLTVFFFSTIRYFSLPVEPKESLNRGWTCCCCWSSTKVFIISSQVCAYTRTNSQRRLVRMTFSFQHIFPNCSFQT